MNICSLFQKREFFAVVNNTLVKQRVGFLGRIAMKLGFSNASMQKVIKLVQLQPEAFTKLQGEDQSGLAFKRQNFQLGTILLFKKFYRKASQAPIH